MLTQAELKTQVNYNQLTGIFYSLNSSARWGSGRILGTLPSSGYIQLRIKGKTYRAHRLAWLYVYGEWPIYSIDHINRIKTDNKISNLRDANSFIQNQNKPIVNKNSHGLKGIYKNKSGKFVAICRNNKIRKQIGCFATANEAHLAYMSYINIGL